MLKITATRPSTVHILFHRPGDIHRANPIVYTSSSFLSALRSIRPLLSQISLRDGYLAQNKSGMWTNHRITNAADAITANTFPTVRNQPNKSVRTKKKASVLHGDGVI